MNKFFTGFINIGEKVTYLVEKLKGKLFCFPNWKLQCNENTTFFIIGIRPQVTYKPHCHCQNSSPLENGIYAVAIINKTLLHNGNCPIKSLITEMGVAHTMEIDLVAIECSWQIADLFLFYFHEMKNVYKE